MGEHNNEKLEFTVKPHHSENSQFLFNKLFHSLLHDFLVTLTECLNAFIFYRLKKQLDALIQKQLKISFLFLVYYSIYCTFKDR